jgi:hypothetical protein
LRNMSLLPNPFELPTELPDGWATAGAKSQPPAQAPAVLPSRFVLDERALYDEIDPLPLFLRGPRPTYEPPDDERSLIAILRVLFGVVA